MFENFWEMVKFGFAFDLGRSIVPGAILLVLLLLVAVAKLLDYIERKQKGW